MAKTPASKNRPAPTRAPAKGGRPAGRVPARGGRPAGLFTWLAVGLVIIVVATLVIIKVTSGGTAGGGARSFQPTDPTTFKEVTTVPASVFNTVGVTSPVAPVIAPQAVKGQSELKTTNFAGTTVPEILYIGAEFCPYCAAQRWPTIIALSRFGTWGGLGNMSSYSGVEDPNTPSFTFVHATYKSKYIAFKGVEEATNYIDAATNYYALLQRPTAAENALIAKYDNSTYIKGFGTFNGGIPFMTLANKFLVGGSSSYSPATLSGTTRNQIAAGLSNATSPITEAIIASANYQSAAICSLTSNQPSSVCTSVGVKTAAKAMGLK